MNKFLLTLLLSPMVLSATASMLVMVQTASAADIPETTTSACVRNSHLGNLVCVRVEQEESLTQPLRELEFTADTAPDPTPMVEFSEEESDRAINLFGCDCIACINSVRQLQGKLPSPNSVA